MSRFAFSSSSIFTRRSSTLLSHNTSYGCCPPLVVRSSSSTASILDKVETRTLTLENGHTVCYSISGSTSSSATSLIFLHSFPSYRFEAVGLEPWAVKFSVRVISPDRPDLGLSTHDPRRKLVNHPIQIAQLTKHLGLKQYRVIGGSGGGPYAVACA